MQNLVLLCNDKKTNLGKLLPVFVVLAAITLVPLATSNVFAQTDETTNVRPDIQRIPDLKFDGRTNGWAIVGNHAHETHLTLDGKAIYNNNGVWIVKSDSKLSIGDRDAKVELKGKVNDNNLRLNGTGELSDGTEFRIILRGHYAPIAGSEGDFAVAFTTALVHTASADNTIRVPLALVGQVHTESVKPIAVNTDDISQEIEDVVKNME